jgi:ribonuclease HIII
MLQTIYSDIKTYLLDQGFKVNPARDIQYGIQFMVFSEKESGLVRLFNGKKGLRVDLSQVKDETLQHQLQIGLEIFLSEKDSFNKLKEKAKHSEKPGDRFAKESLSDPEKLIGVDESGKGDYFGPLVVAGVYVDATLTKMLKAMGVADSKTLSDDKMREMAPKIKELCPHSLVILNNHTYNDIYEKIQNLNVVLAWGHARVIENTLLQVPTCGHALSDKFGPDHLIRDALRKKDIKITLFQRTKAESNIAVAAASVLARDMFLEYIEDLEKRYGHAFPKGCSEVVLKTAARFLKKHGRTELGEVAKTHFKVTEQIEKLIGL